MLIYRVTQDFVASSFGILVTTEKITNGSLLNSARKKHLHKFAKKIIMKI